MHAPVMFAERPHHETITENIARLFEAGHPCVFGLSGKDSAMVAALTFEAARRHVAGGGRAKVLALTADTGIENPGVVAVRRLEYTRMRQFATAHGIDFEGHVSEPTLLNSWAVRTLSGRALPSFHNSHRDCSIDWKQSPLRALRNSVLNRLRKAGKPAVVLLGNRFEESTSRLHGMRERNETWGEPWLGHDGHLYMSPIALLSTDDVWEFHGLCANGLFRTFSDFSELRTLYADSGGGSCSIVGAMATEEVKSSRPCSARQGCILCLAVGERDRSLESMIETNPDYLPLEPVRQLRQFLYATRYDWSRRNWIGRTISQDGFITIAPDAYGSTMLRELRRLVWSIDANEQERARRVGTAPLFELCPLASTIAIDALLDLNGLAAPFSALKDFIEIRAGRRYAVPALDPVPATPIPDKRYLFVGKDWDANTRCFGLRDFLLETAEGCGFDPVRLRNGRVITDYPSDDVFSVDLDGALDFLQFAADELIARCGDGAHPTTGFRTYLQYGTISLGRKARAVTDMIARRTAWKHSHGLTGNFDPLRVWESAKSATGCEVGAQLVLDL
ncbi:MAG: phosphoadenosine phosphosulfate sulfotransferase [Thermomicrobiales bacterium]|nr:MAG: phosphoadenosine phosphosulfate sulfotransferase [Thermomicrobiales bacterium]